MSHDQDFRHAKKILDHLVDTIEKPSCRHRERYEPILKEPEELKALLLSLVRKDVLRLFQQANVSPKSLANLRGDINYPSRAIYLHLIYDQPPFRRVRMYIGQSQNLQHRIWRQYTNFRFRRDNPSLHYTAFFQSSFDTFIPLAYIGKIQSLSDPRHHHSPIPIEYENNIDLAMNLLEMWCCLLFQTLPIKRLREWFPSDCPLRGDETEHLNISLPLDNGDGVKNLGAIHDLAGSKDPLVRSCYGRLEERHHRYRGIDTKIEEEMDVDLGQMIIEQEDEDEDEVELTTG